MPAFSLKWIQSQCLPWLGCQQQEEQPLSPCRAAPPCSVLQSQGCSCPAAVRCGDPRQCFTYLHAWSCGWIKSACSRILPQPSEGRTKGGGEHWGAGEHELTPYVQVGALGSRDSSGTTRCFQQRGSKMHPWGWNNFINHSGFLCKCTSFDSFFSSAALSCFLFLSCFKLHV